MSSHKMECFHCGAQNVYSRKMVATSKRRQCRHATPNSQARCSVYQSLEAVKRLLLAVMLMLPMSMGAYAATQESEAQQQQLEELRQSMAELKEKLEAAKSEHETLLNNLETSETEMGGLNEKVEQLKQDLKEKQSHLNRLHSEKLALDSAKKEQALSVKQHIRAAYQLGQHNDLKLLLGQENPSDIQRHLKYYRYILKARQEKIGAFTETLNQIARVEPTIAAETRKIQSKKKILDQRKQKLFNVTRDRKQTLATLSKLISEKDQEYAALAKDRSRLEEVMQRVTTLTENLNLASHPSAISTLKGKLPWPTTGKLAARYGSARVGNKLRWQGILIQANAGSPVQAVHHGRVVFSDYLRGQGMLLIVDHGEGMMSLYAHNQTLYKSVGDWVTAGDVIASVGSSGGQAKSQLYFEIRRNGQPTNPASWLKRA